MSQNTLASDRSFTLPPLGDNPSTNAEGTTPASFANKGRIGTPYTYSSPDTPGMPEVSDKTAWDFMPEGWRTEIISADPIKSANEIIFQESNGSFRRVNHPANFTPITQLEHARLGIITPQMKRVAEREPHLTAEQVRDEVAAGRMVIPANINHLKHRLDPMCIGRASLTKINANMGASPVSSSTDEEVEKLKWAERWKSDTVMDLSTGGDLNVTRRAIIENATVPIGTVPLYSMIIGRKIEDLDWAAVEAELINQCEQGVDYM